MTQDRTLRCAQSDRVDSSHGGSKAVILSEAKNLAHGEHKMLRWLRRWLGYDEEPLVELVGGLSDPDAEMWGEMLRNNGIPVVVKSRNPLVGYLGTRAVALDYSFHVRASDAARARQLLTPLLKSHADPSRQPRRLRRQRGTSR